MIARFLTVTLILALAMGSVTQAVAHFVHGVGTSVELCADGVGQTLIIGPTGQPLPAAPHDCHDCIAAPGSAGVAAMATPGFDPVSRAVAFHSRAAKPQQGPRLAAALARAPPFFV